ncbi:MAG: hypothetical protein HQK49_21310 [Oligoflexia bacterium]|nr:hypothetical protein [Oligoflexia bacterium]
MKILNSLNLKQLILLFIVIFYSSSAFAFSWQFPFFDFLKKKNEVLVKKAPTNSTVINSPLHVKVGIYVLHVGKYDLQGANYEMDFYLIFSCNQACNNLNFEIMNATNVNAQKVANHAGMLVYRVRAELIKANNLRNYPFDEHTLEIIIEDRHLTNDKIIFEEDIAKTALDSQLNVVGFNLSPKWTAKVSNHYYKVFQRASSSYKFSINIKRPVLAGFLKGILPALIIVLCNFLALFIRTDHISQRLGVATSTLTALVVFHLNLTNSIPPLGYMTYADMFMFINYISLFIVLIEVVATLFFMESKHRKFAGGINRFATFAIPFGWIAMQTIVWFLYNPINSVVK